MSYGKLRCTAIIREDNNKISPTIGIKFLGKHHDVKLNEYFRLRIH